MTFQIIKKKIKVSIRWVNKIIFTYKCIDYIFISKLITKYLYTYIHILLPIYHKILNIYYAH